MWPAFPGGVYIPHFQAHWINKQAGKRTFDTSGEIYSQEHDNNTKQVSKLTWSNWFGNLFACIILSLILERLTGKQMKVSNMTHESIALVAFFYAFNRTICSCFMKTWFPAQFEHQSMKESWRALLKLNKGSTLLLDIGPLNFLPALAIL